MADNTFPLFVFVFDIPPSVWTGGEWVHNGGTPVYTTEQLGAFMVHTVFPAISKNIEVMITDSDDFAVFHSKNGQIIYPTKEMLEATA